MQSKEQNNTKSCKRVVSYFLKMQTHQNEVTLFVETLKLREL